MRIRNVTGKYLLVGLLLFALVFLMLHSRTVIGRFNTNLGFVTLNTALSTQAATTQLNAAASAEDFFARAADVDQGNLSTIRGLALSAGLQDNSQHTLATFNDLGVWAAEHYALLGNSANRSGYRDLALFWYKQAVNQDPRQISTWMKLGEVYEKEGEIDEAIAAYERVWIIAPALAFKPYVSALLAQSRNDEAEELLQELLYSDAQFYERLWGWHTLGQLLKKQERWDEANHIYSAALNEYEQDASLLVSLGWSLYEQEKNRGQAVRHFEDAISVDSDSGAGYFAMGQLMAKENKYTEAEAWFKSALERNDSNPRWRLIRANTARQSADYDLAVAAYQDTITRYPAYAPAYYELAHTYRLLDSPEQVVQILDKANELSLNPPIRYYLSTAELYEWSGRLDLAIQTYQNLLDIDPGNNEALERMNQLQSD